MTGRSSILASDSDRESVAERLRQAASEGRILAHELEERVARALRARTYGELDQLVADLPRSGTPARSGSRAVRVARGHPVAAVAILVAFTLVVFVTAAVVMALSGIWVLFLVILVARRGAWSGGPGRRSGPRGGSRNGYGTAYPSRRGPYWVR